MFGCPHYSDPESTALVGQYEALDPKHLILGSKRLIITDAHHLQADDGKVYRYSVSEEFFGLDAEGYHDMCYSPDYAGYPEGIMFSKFASNGHASQDMYYKRVR